MMILGFAVTRLTKLLRLPNVTAYILTGIAIGPFCLDLIPHNIIEGMDFFSDIALAFIAFGTGEFFKLSVLKKNGMRIVVLTLFESLMASVFVFVLTYNILGLGMAFSIVLAALASATAPASTIMTIRQTGAKGDFVNTLLQVVALDDIVSIVAYSVAISVALSSLSDNGSASRFQTVVLPILYNLGVMVLGGFFGYLLKWLMPKKRSTDNRLIIAVSLLFAFCGVSMLLGVSPLLGCMMMGTVYINITGDDKLFKQLAYFSPPILLLFFVRSGLSFDLGSLFGSTGSVAGVPLILIAALYFIVRIAGKYVGSYAGCAIIGKPKEVRNNLGLALIPQAGVAIGLSALCARTLGSDVGGDLQTIILASSVLYELVGPACAKLSLYLSHSYSTKLEEITQVKEVNESGVEKTPVQLLIDRINAIQSELPKRDERLNEEEAAFTQAAEEQFEQFEALGGFRRRGLISRR